MFAQCISHRSTVCNKEVCAHKTASQVHTHLGAYIGSPPLQTLPSNVCMNSFSVCVSAGTVTACKSSVLCV